MRDVRSGRFMYSASDINDSGNEEFFQSNEPMMSSFYSSRLELVAGDAFDLPFRENSFDAVISQYLGTHFEGDKELIAEARRATRKEGFIGFWDEKNREVETHTTSEDRVDF